MIGAQYGVGIRAQCGIRVKAQSAQPKTRFRAQLGGGQSQNSVWAPAQD